MVIDTYSMNILMWMSYCMLCAGGMHGASRVNTNRLALIICVAITAFVFWSFNGWTGGGTLSAPVPACPKCPAPIVCHPCEKCPKPQDCPVCKAPEPCPKQQECAIPSPVAQCPLAHEPINFEPPQTNSLTGPRPSPLKKHQKSLVTIPAGNAGKENVDKLVRKFGLENFQFILFHYDMSDWSNVSWYKDVISIRVPGRMKWWYMKRFITPQMAEMYEYVFAIDEDSDPESIDIPAFMNILRTHKIHIAQPAVTSGYSHQFTAVVQHNDPAVVGRFTDFVECGPFAVVSSEAWAGCVWDFIQEDCASGWGLDLYWHQYCKYKLGFDKSAIIDKYPQVHRSFRTAHADNANKPKYDPGAELNAYHSRFTFLKQTEMKQVGLVKMPPQ